MTTRIIQESVELRINSGSIMSMVYDHENDYECYTCWATGEPIAQPRFWEHKNMRLLRPHQQPWLPWLDGPQP